MTFPNLRNEIKIGGAWTDVTAYNYTRDLATIKRGRPDETSKGVPPPSTLVTTLDNRDGRFSPRNPLGLYWGLLGTNQPIRSSVPGDGTKYCRLPGKYGTDNVSTPDNAALHITGDIDIRVDATLDNWLQYQTLAGRWLVGGTASSWILYLGGGGQVRFAWSLTGADVTNVTDYRVYASTANISAAAGSRLAVRVTLAVSTGVLTFYTAPTSAGSWTQLGATTGPGAATTLFGGTEPLILAESGQGRTSNISICAGRINNAQVLNGIAGTAVANPDFTAQTIGATSFTDAAGRVWSLNGDTEITDRLYRIHAEVSEFPQRWDLSGKDVWTPITASGILRRLGQGKSAVQSPLARAITTSSKGALAYWKCEDASGATSIASSSNAPAMTVSGSPSFAADTHIGGSAALPTLGGSTWTGTVPNYTLPSTNSALACCVLYLPTAPATGTIIMRVQTTTARFDVGWSNGGLVGFYLNCYDATGALTSADNSGGGFVATALNQPISLELTLTQSGGNIKPTLVQRWPAQTFTSYIGGGTGVPGTLGKVKTIVINPGGGLSDTALGHVDAYAPALTGYPPQATAYSGNLGETAGNRFVRLCLEQGIQPRTWGDPADSPAMGGQGTATLLDLLQQCLDVDGGLMYEPRDILGIGMRMRSSLFDEASAVTLSHNGGHLSGVLEPTSDDQKTRNDWEYTNTGTGNKARATLDTGTKSVLDWPNGVGRYDDTASVNLSGDALLDDLASWAVHVGTVDEDRFPAFQSQLEGAAYGAASSAFSQSVQRLDIGQVVTLTGWPSGQAPNDSRQLLQGISEVFGNNSWIITFNGSPASPYDVILLDDGTAARLDTDGSTLHDATLTSGATSFQVDTTNASSPLWTTSAGDFPFDVMMGGEQITVTNITGSSSPQTFTVTRSVNGIVKAHTIGEDIRLARPFYLAPY